MTLNAIYDEQSGCVILSGDTENGPLTITRTGDEGCATHVGETPLEIRVVDGVFSFTDCSAGPGRTFIYEMGEESAGVVTTLPDCDDGSCDPLWIKNKRDPSLNMITSMVGLVPETNQQARTGVFDVIGRKTPVAVSDVRQSKSWTVNVLTKTIADARRFEQAMCPGDTVLLQTSCGHPVLCRDEWFAILSVSRRVVKTSWPNVSCCCCSPGECRHRELSIWELTLREVAEPRHDDGSLATWDCLCESGLTWNDLCAAYTWDEVCAVDGPARCPADDGCGCS